MPDIESRLKCVIALNPGGVVDELINVECIQLCARPLRIHIDRLVQKTSRWCAGQIERDIHPRQLRSCRRPNVSVAIRRPPESELICQMWCNHSGECRGDKARP